MATRLQNLSRQPRTYILHVDGDVGERLPKVKQTVVTEQYDPKTGARSTKETKRKLPSSITLQPKGIEGDVIEGLPDGVALCEQIAADAKAGVIGLAVMPDPPPAPPDPPPGKSQKPKKEEG